MYYVYLLRSSNHDFIYIGCTSDLGKRVLEYDRGEVKSTKFYRPLKLVYYEAYLDKIDALKRESKLKHHGSVIGHLKKRISNSLLSE